MTPWTVACQAPLSLGFSTREHWSGLQFSPPGDLPDPGIKPKSPALTGGFFSPRALTHWHGHHRCWRISSPGRRSGAGPSYLLVGAVFDRPFPRREERACCCGHCFTCHVPSGPPIPTALGPTFQSVGRGIGIPSRRRVLCLPPPLSRFDARLLAEGRDDSRLRWQDRLCSVLSHRRKPVGFAWF